MKKLFLILSSIFLFFYMNNCLSQTWGVGPELLFSNNTGSGGYNLHIKFYPIGTVYNAQKLYSPKVGGVQINNVPYLAGYETIISKNDSHVVYGQYDGVGNVQRCSFVFGLGLYRVEFYQEDSTELLNYCYIDFRDANVLEGTYPYTTDLGLYFYSPDSINFFWAESGSNPPLNINAVDNLINHWEYEGTPEEPLVPSKGLFKMDPSNEIFLEFPINFKKFNDNLGHGDPGEIGLNLLMNYNINTHDTLISNPTNITISPRCYLKIDTNKNFRIITAISGSNNLIISDTAKLILGARANVTVEANNKLTLKSKGEINLAQNSSIVFELGSVFVIREGKYFIQEMEACHQDPREIYFLKKAIHKCHVGEYQQMIFTLEIVLTS